MRFITDRLFEAYLRCPLKCFLLSKGEKGKGNTYAAWFRNEEDAYLGKYVRDMVEGHTAGNVIGVIPESNLENASWQNAIGLTVRTSNLETVVHLVERIPTDRRGGHDQVIPFRLTFTNKLDRVEKLRLAFDSFVLSKARGQDIPAGKIIHGEKYDTTKIRTAFLQRDVLEAVSKTNALLSRDTPPKIGLNQHCTECDFQADCRQKALAKDDLSLLQTLSEKQRNKLNSKGIFTVAHLSYTFRPRRKPKRYIGKGEQYHHSLKALAIRERKTHVVGGDELRIEGTPVYLDVEGIPDRDFYYLIGIRFRGVCETIQHTLWADSQEDEGRIWQEFVNIISQLEEPTIVHYGSFETVFLKHMQRRYGCVRPESVAGGAINATSNMVSYIYARIYFPTYSNGLKDIAAWLGFHWADANASGIQTIPWRSSWEKSRDPDLKQKLITYNTQDCEALEYVTESVVKILSTEASGTDEATGVVHTDSLYEGSSHRFGRVPFRLPALEEINRAAYWDYQHERLTLRSGERRKKASKTSPRKTMSVIKVNSTVSIPPPQACPRCGRTKLYIHKKYSHIVVDIRFGKAGIKRWVTRYLFNRYLCPACGTNTFVSIDPLLSREKYGLNLNLLSIYLNIDLMIPQARVAEFISRIFGLAISRMTIHVFKAKAAAKYGAAYCSILQDIANGNLVHADETEVKLGRETCYVWAFANATQVAYVYSPSREGSLVKTVLKDFKGVLVTDYYSAYDSIVCPQQKCLVHLSRDFNEGLMKEPFNREIKTLTSDFAALLRSIVATVDRFGLKARYLKKHKTEVRRFFKRLSRCAYESETARKYKERLERNQDKLFTFLDYDDVPWNNNNAEHAIKAIAHLRKELGGQSTEKGLRDYLVLLSIRETCRYQGVDFFEFLRSGEKDLNAYAENKRSHRGRRIEFQA